ncbi:MAG: hydrolase, partial [Acidimicrobiia bacterium]|nr:hydrolase [Acidimicrobiia bacterium]
MERQVDLEAYQAVLFDLDGVITDTASLHAAAWKAMFDGF